MAALKQEAAGAMQHKQEASLTQCSPSIYDMGSHIDRVSREGKEGGVDGEMGIAGGNWKAHGS